MPIFKNKTSGPIAISTLQGKSLYFPSRVWILLDNVAATSIEVQSLIRKGFLVCKMDKPVSVEEKPKTNKVVVRKGTPVVSECVVSEPVAEAVVSEVVSTENSDAAVSPKPRRRRKKKVIGEFNG